MHVSTCRDIGKDKGKAMCLGKFLDMQMGTLDIGIDMCIETRVHMCIDMHIHMCIDTHMHMCIDMHVHMHMHMNRDMHMRMCMDVCTYMRRRAQTGSKTAQAPMILIAPIYLWPYIVMTHMSETTQAPMIIIATLEGVKSVNETLLNTCSCP